MTYKKALVKYKIEYFFIFPLIQLGKIIGKFVPLQTEHSIFLFFSSADVGGAIKVNADIVNCIKDKKPLIIFSKKPKNNDFKHLFDIDDVRIIDLHKYIDNKVFHFINIIYRGIIATWINKQQNATVFGGECLYFYKIIPHLNKNINKIELVHLNTWINYTQTFLTIINKRIFSTKKILRDVQQQYSNNNINKLYNEKLLFIDNYIEIPELISITNSILQIVFVGRGAPQKRVYLIAVIAKKIFENNIKAHISFVGDVENIINKNDYPFCTFYGIVKETGILNNIYQQSDVLLLTSAYEGLPIVVMDMMARGKIILSTAVDGIPDYIEHKKNGLLLYEKDEAKIVDEAVQCINEIIINGALKNSLQKNSYNFAKNNFNKQKFETFYKYQFVN